MKRILLFLLTLVTVSFTAVTDWTATANDGKTYNLQEMLDAGKAVVLHFAYTG